MSHYSSYAPVLLAITLDPCEPGGCFSEFCPPFANGRDKTVQNEGTRGERNSRNKRTQWIIADQKSLCNRPGAELENSFRAT